MTSLVPGQLDDHHVEAASSGLGDQPVEHDRVERCILAEGRVVPRQPFLHELPLLGVGQRLARVERVRLVRPSGAAAPCTAGRSRAAFRYEVSAEKMPGQDRVRVLVLAGVLRHPAPQRVALEQQLTADDLVVVALAAGSEAPQVHADQHRRRRVRQIVDDRPALRVALHARAQVVRHHLRPAVGLDLAGQRRPADDRLAAARAAEEHAQRDRRRMPLEVADGPRDDHVVVGRVAHPALHGDGAPGAAREEALNAEKRRPEKRQRHDEHQRVPVPKPRLKLLTPAPRRAAPATAP